MRVSEEKYVDNRDMRDRGYVGPLVVPTDSSAGVDMATALDTIGEILKNDKNMFQSKINSLKAELIHCNDMLDAISRKQFDLKEEIDILNK